MTSYMQVFAQSLKSKFHKMSQIFIPSCSFKNHMLQTFGDHSDHMRPINAYISNRALIYYRDVVIDLKSVEALKMRFVAPMPEQSGTPPMHFCKLSREPY